MRIHSKSFIKKTFIRIVIFTFKYMIYFWNIIYMSKTLKFLPIREPKTHHSDLNRKRMYKESILLAYLWKYVECVLSLHISAFIFFHLHLWVKITNISWSLPHFKFGLWRLAGFVIRYQNDSLEELMEECHLIL